MTQTTLFPEEDDNFLDLTIGILYICVGENAVFKFGISKTSRGKDRRITDHRKYVPTLREVWSKLIPNHRHHETALRRTLESLAPDARITGSLEWWRLTAYTAELLLTFAAQVGGTDEDLAYMSRQFARIIAAHANHPVFGTD